MLRSIFLILGLLLLVFVSFVAWPLPENFFARPQSLSLSITDRNGIVLREVLSRDEGRSVPLPPHTKIPEWVEKAFIASEDQRFYSHFGADPKSIFRAALQNIRERRIVSGASTIPQQLARQIVPRKRNVFGKIQELLWALRISVHTQKSEILREYLNRIPLGNGIYGVEAAAHFYFQRDAAHLSVAQAAMLAGMASAPSAREPYRHFELAKKGMRSVLARMQKSGSLLAVETPLDLEKSENTFRAPHAIEAVLRLNAKEKSADSVRIETTLDTQLQEDVEALVKSEISYDKSMTQAAALVVDNSSGDILAYVGSTDFLDDEHQGQNDGVLSSRQPGSALKPFAYGLALERGFTPASLLSDIEVRLSTERGDYAPKNYDRRVHGPVRLRAALANSYNIPAVNLVEQLGVAPVLNVLRLAGFESLRDSAEHYGVGLILGNGDVTLWELARAYRGLARGGIVAPLRLVKRATGRDGKTSQFSREISEQKFLSREATEWLTDILIDETSRAPAFGFDNALRLPFQVAAKTGTSHAYVDNWTVGFTKERTVAVWCGNFDGKPMRKVSGISGAGPIFSKVMLRAMRDLNPAPLVDPSHFERAQICALSGQLATEACPSRLEEVFLPKKLPTKKCEMHSAHNSAVDVGPEYENWARAEGIETVRNLEVTSPKLLSPKEGDTYLLAPGLPPGSQRIPLRVDVPSGVKSLIVHLDGKKIEHTFLSELPAEEGRHRLEIYLPHAAVPFAVAEYQVVN